jgi:glycerol-3-phosphate dehydrogenase (NAD(P)+)
VSTYTVFGAGAWGFALADLLARAGHRVALWGRNAARIESLRATRRLPDRMAGCELHAGVTPVADLAGLPAANACVFAIPTAHLRDFLTTAGFRGAAPAWINAAKGIEQSTLVTAGNVLAEFAPDGTDVFTLSGPSHAEELARGIPTSIVLAGPDTRARDALQGDFATAYCRIYASSDRLGVELAGALKNVVALAAGVCDGLGFGDNTRGALITRGLAEITRLGQKLGGRWETFAGLAGMGDLITTCCSQHSRNRRVGFELGQGRSLEQILAAMSEVAEGVTTTPAARELGLKHDLELPITDQVYAVLYKKKPPAEAVRTLMTRTLKEEAPTYAV